MNTPQYLALTIASLLPKTKQRNYWYHYNIIKLKKLCAHTMLIFFLQATTIVSLPITHPGLALYPPFGIIFIMFYFLGRSALPGILLGTICGYLVKDSCCYAMLLYLLADIGCGCLCAYLCQNIFSLDLNIWSYPQEILQFIKTNVITCTLAAAIRVLALISSYKINMDPDTLFYTFINLWLADLNAILILAGFTISWVYVPFSRARISTKKIGNYQILLLVAFVVLCMFYMKNTALIYLIIPAMLVNLYLAKVYGHLIATALLFSGSTIYLSYFISIQYRYGLYADRRLYILVPTILLLYTLTIFYINYGTLLRDQSGNKIDSDSII